MSRDTLYQNVRGHLAYLKLTAAAEALPGELDTAIKTKATHTEFLGSWPDSLATSEPHGPSCVVGTDPDVSAPLSE